MLTDMEKMNRWRLLLGKFSNGSLGCMSDSRYERMEQMLDFLYSREYGDRGIDSEQMKKEGFGMGDSNLTVPDWITKVRELFPAKTVEILEKHALDRYDLTEMLTDKETLEKLKPNMQLLTSIVQMKHLMRGEVLNSAMKIVRKVVEELKREMEQEIRQTISGAVNRQKPSSIKSLKNLDMKKTIKRNLKHFDTEKKQLQVEKLFFHSRSRLSSPWDIIISVDESGSMLNSVIHSAVMAGIFAALPSLRTKLFIFDTQIVDLSDYIDDIVRTVMSVQLGGGTDIALAFRYCQKLISNPHKTIVVMVTDLYAGYDMFPEAKKVIESGAKLIILTSLDETAQPDYDKEAAAKMSAMGAEVAALTPENLAKWIAKIIS